MNDMKYWYQSKTVWGALITILASLLNAGGIAIDDASQQEIVDGLITIAGAFGGLLAIYGRITADRRLG